MLVGGLGVAGMRSELVEVPEGIAELWLVVVACVVAVTVVVVVVVVVAFAVEECELVEAFAVVEPRVAVPCVVVESCIVAGPCVVVVAAAAAGDVLDKVAGQEHGTIEGCGQGSSGALGGDTCTQEQLTSCIARVPLPFSVSLEEVIEDLDFVPVSSQVVRDLNSHTYKSFDLCMHTREEGN